MSLPSQILIVLFLLSLLINQSHQTNKEEYQVHISMPAGIPKMHDDYLCVSMKANNPGYIRKFIPTASGDRAHHLLLFGCFGSPNTTRGTWQCLSENICADGTYARLLYSWTKNAAEFVLPDNVGIPLGEDLQGPQYLVLQVHYAHVLLGNVVDYTGVTMVMQKAKPKYFARIYLLIGSGDDIPAGLDNFQLNMSCLFISHTDVFAFAFRVHAHLLGQVISGYVHRDSKDPEEWGLLGKSNPLWPQWYYPVPSGPVVIHPGDVLAGQCNYDTRNRSTPTRFGPTEEDEMCNFYIYYYAEADEVVKIQHDGCPNNKIPQVFSSYPVDGSTHLPVNKELERMAAGNKNSFEVIEEENWLKEDLNIGEIAGLSSNKDFLYIFHRGSRKYLNNKSFDDKNIFIENTTIANDTILVLDYNTIEIVDSYGASMFYMPEDIFVDWRGNIWVVDMGAHLVLKFSPASKTEPILTIGETLIPGNDRLHLCRPSSVVATASGVIYVADGICNSRIVRYFSDGTFDTSFGAKAKLNPFSNENLPPLGEFGVIHKISADEQRQFLYVSDTEFGRVQIFNWTENAFVGEFRSKKIGDHVGPMKYCPETDTLFLANAELTHSGPKEIRIFAADPDSRGLLYSFGSTGKPLELLTEMAFSRDCLNVFVVEQKPNSLRRFNISFTNRANPQETNKLMAEAESSLNHNIITQRPTLAVAIVIGVLGILGFGVFLIWLFQQSKAKTDDNYMPMA